MDIFANQFEKKKEENRLFYIFHHTSVFWRRCILTEKNGRRKFSRSNDAYVLPKAVNSAIMKSHLFLFWN
jgi:hypothetical protein